MYSSLTLFIELIYSWIRAYETGKRELIKRIHENIFLVYCLYCHNV